MNIKTTTITLLLALSTFASARIGETEAQCEARYGESVDVGKSGARYYSKNGIFLSVKFNSRGKAYRLIYSNAPSDDMSVSHAQILVEANGSGWVKERLSDEVTTWKTKDNVAFINKTGWLFVMTKAEFERSMAEVEKRNEELRAF